MFKNTWKLISAFLKVNIQQALAYRADTWLNIVLNVFWLGWELISLQVIFSNTSTLSGWGFGEMIVLLGAWRMANVLMGALVWPNTEKFNSSIRDGSFDYTLLQPVNSQFLVSFSRVVVWRVWEVLLALALLGVGLAMTPRLANLPNLLGFFLLVASGMAVLYSLWIVLIAFTFWFTKFDNNVTLLQALMDAGRYPASVYPAWLRFLVTFVIPIAVATTIPVQTLRGELGALQVLGFVALAAACVLISSQVWKAGVRRYSSASS
jgi:ABC-2 type transport system permease protein